MLGERTLFRAYLLSTDHAYFAPTYERLVLHATHRKLAGATVLRGIYGFGARGIQDPSPWHLTLPTPVIVEIVDHADRIADFIGREIPGLITHGMFTLERAGVLFYRQRHPPRATEPRTPLELLAGVKDLSTIPQLGSLPMKNNEDGILLRIFAGDSDTTPSPDGHPQPLYKAIVHKARELGLAGATVLRGSMGFGANTVLHTAKVLELSTDLPIVIELVDREENIRKLLPYLDSVVAEGMITMESVRILVYRHNPQDAPRPSAP
jgi:uncharacterized protein